MEKSLTTTPATLLEIAVSQNADIEKLEKLMDLHMKWEQNEARKAYHAAMAAFKADPPAIGKDKHVQYSTSKGMTDYKHSSLANVTSTINKALSKHGLSASWKTAQSELITVTCTITHILGHSESTSLSAAPDQSGGKNNIQAIGSTVSYLERYTILAITGLASSDMDDDGRGPVAFITGEQANELQSIIDDNNLNPEGEYIPKFLKWIKAESIAEIHSSDFSKAKNGLLEVVRRRKKA